jgi:ribulose-5-phosphate 4-epimerase/fuculose-1-phosphate aldolase
MTNPALSIPARPQGYSADEWTLRCQLADCYHLVDHMGWSETIFNHISARLPGDADHYLVNPFGLLYDEVTPENLLKVGLDGEKLEASEYDANPAAFALHGAIHAARGDIHCVIHTHSTAISAIARKKNGLSHDDFYGAQLFGRVGYHDFEGITLVAEERSRMVQSLGDHHVLILRNHGIAIGEQTIAKTFFLLWTVQRAAEVQCLADSMRGEDAVLSNQIRQTCADQAAMLIRDHDFADAFFRAMVRDMRRHQRRR